MINQFSMEEIIGVSLTLPKLLATFLHANYARFKLLGIGEEQQLFNSKALENSYRSRHDPSISMPETALLWLDI